MGDSSVTIDGLTFELSEGCWRLIDDTMDDMAGSCVGDLQSQLDVVIDYLRQQD